MKPAVPQARSPAVHAVTRVAAAALRHCGKVGKFGAAFEGRMRMMAFLDGAMTDQKGEDGRSRPGGSRGTESFADGPSKLQLHIKPMGIPGPASPWCPRVSSDHSRSVVRQLPLASPAFTRSTTRYTRRLDNTYLKMKSTTYSLTAAAGLLALASLATAQSFCAITCFQNVVTEHPPLDCTEDNMYLCFCKSQSLQNYFIDCAYDDCASEAQAAVDFGVNLCSGMYLSPAVRSDQDA